MTPLVLRHGHGFFYLCPEHPPPPQKGRGRPPLPNSHQPRQGKQGRAGWFQQARTADHTPRRDKQRRAVPAGRARLGLQGRRRRALHLPGVATTPHAPWSNARAGKGRKNPRRGAATARAAGPRPRAGSPGEIDKTKPGCRVRPAADHGKRRGARGSRAVPGTERPGRRRGGALAPGYQPQAVVDGEGPLAGRCRQGERVEEEQEVQVSALRMHERKRV